MTRSPSFRMTCAVLLAWAITANAGAGNLDRPRDLPSFFSNASLMLANYLKVGETLGSPGADSRDWNVHYDWAVQQSPGRLHSELEEKVTRMVDLRASESSQSLGDFYGHVAATWATYGVSFGSVAADNVSFDFHARWARGQSPSRLKDELRQRVHALIASYGPATLRSTRRLDRPTYFADASLLLTQFLQLDESLGSAGADSRRRSEHFLWAQSQSRARLEAALIAKIDRLIDLRSAGGGSVSDVYGSLATTWSFYGVDFGDAAANSHDYSRHAQWAGRVAPQLVKDQLGMRVKKIIQALPEFAMSLERAWPCDYGDPTCNRCVANIESTFREGVFGYRRTISGGIEEGPTGRLRLHLREGSRLPPNGSTVTGAGGFKSHVQSIVRLPAGGTGSWLVMGRARRSPGAPFYVFEAGGPPRNHGGYRFIPFDVRNRRYYDAFRDNASGRDRTRAYVEIPSTEHIGGMQAVGNIVAMPVTCDASCTAPEVMFWDFADPLDPQLRARLTLPRPAAAHWVALARLESGQYLLIVNRSNDGTTDAFLTRTSHPIGEATSWRPLGRFNIATTAWDTGSGTYQNANFVSGCGSNELYLLAMRQLGTVGLRQWKDDNLVELFRVHDGLSHGSGTVELSYVSGATFERFGDYCQMRGGSSVYVEPNGSPVIYCAAGQSDSGALKVSEVTAHQ